MGRPSALRLAEPHIAQIKSYLTAVHKDGELFTPVSIPYLLEMVDNLRKSLVPGIAPETPTQYSVDADASGSAPASPAGPAGARKRTPRSSSKRLGGAA
jgi:hypothetical protein